MEGDDFCAVHRPAARKDDTMMVYQLGRFQERASKFVGDERLKSLHGEVAVMRHLLEVIHGECDGKPDLAIKSSTIVNLCKEITHTVNTLNAIEMKLGGLLDRERVATLAQTLLKRTTEAVKKHAPEKAQEILRELSNDFLADVKGA